MSIPIAADRRDYGLPLVAGRARDRVKENHVTRYRIFRNCAAETTYISPHEGSMVRNPQEFPNLDVALAVLRDGGIPEYELKRVTKELAAINGAIVQAPETIVLS